MGDKTSATAYLSSGLTLWLGAVDWNTVCMVGGFLIGLATFAVNWYYKRENSRVYREAVKNGVQKDAPKE